jgi:tetratricopeptide (TPR) repeat protein
MRGTIAAIAHKWGAADHWFALVSARTPSLPFADEAWGEALLTKGDLDGAIAKFEQAHRIGPHFADPLEMWGEALIAKNRSDLALAKFAEAAKYAPNWGRLHLKWGEALAYLGQTGDAKTQFAIAAGLDLSPVDKSTLKKWMTARD